MEKQTLLNNNNIISGVTYFKLSSNLEGDTTKNCGLLGEEIDGNFYFLRGYDIKNIYVDNNRNIIIERVNQEYAPFKINIDDSINLLDLELDKEHGSIILHYPNGAEKKIEGLLVKGNEIEFITDGSIEGTGTLSKPLKMSNIEKTGVYRPVSEFLDLTNGNVMPSGKEKGYRILTKEYLNTFGCLYSLESLNKLQKILIDNNSEWRVPSKQDWDELLNAMEINYDAKNHGLETSGWHGEVAGIALKSSKYWKKYETSNDDIPVDGQNVSGLNILPLGIGTNRNEVLNEIDNDIEGFSKIAGFWTSSLDLSNNAYVKIFGYNSAKVGQDIYGKGARMSIRLVKDFNGNNYNELEKILDGLYPTVLVNSVCSNENYSKIWTTINFHDTKNLDGVTSKEWAEIEDINEISDIYFFINEWDGYKWSKKLLNNGDSVVIENNDKPYHEWRVINDNLIDTLTDAYNAIDEKLKPYATISYVEDLIVGLEEGDVELGGYVKLETLQSSITETKKEVNDYTNAEIEKLEDVYADKKTLETLIGYDSGTSVRNIVSEEVAKIVASADSKFDTLKEIADWIGTASGVSAATLVADIEALKKADTALTETINGVDAKVTALTQTVADNKTAVDNKFKEYYTSAQTDSKIAEAKAEAIGAASAYTDGEVTKVQTALTETINGVDAKVDTLIGVDSGRTARSIAVEEVAKIVASADSKFDTLKEIADYIISDSEGAAQIVNEVSQLKAVSADTRLTVLEKKVSDLENYIKILEEKIKKIEENNGGNTPFSPEEIKIIIKDYIVGKDNEIKIENNADGSKLIISFDDDAIFG